MRGKGEGAIFKDSRGLWTAVVELPPGPDGQRRRKRVRSKDKKKVIEKLQTMQRELAELGDLPTSSQTVEQWLRYWLDEIAARRVAPNTLAGYRTAVRTNIVPSIGAVRLSQLTAAHVRRMHRFVTDTLELSSTTALLAHRTLSVALKVALREGRVTRNAAALVDPPQKSVAKLEVLTLGEALDVLEYCADDSLGAVWATSLLTAARRGEVIGLERDRVGSELDYSWQLQRIAWQHGCSKPCGWSRAADCPNRRHLFPPSYEARPIDGGLFWTRPKSKAGWRVVPLVEPLQSMLQEHVRFTPANQYGLVFDLNGRPIDPDAHSARWHGVLKEVGITKRVRLHDVRHTTVDLLYLAGVPEDMIQSIVGHSTRVQTRAYRSRVDRARLVSAMEQLSDLINSRGGGRRQAPAE